MDPVTGEPVEDMLLDPNVAGRIPEREYEGEEMEAERTDPPRVRSKDAVRILVDINDPNWREDVTEAYAAAVKALGINLEGKETRVIKEGL